MPLGPFALISLFYVVLGIRLVVQLARNFRKTFDRTFTPQDRMLVDQTAFFILLPISVALHELGHAVAIWLFGGEVLDWGFYGFAGYVAFDPSEFTNAQQILIAAAGTIVNVLLAALAVGAVFLKRPPFRAAINELLIQFTWISLLNALVVYPLLDVVSGLNGDWTQMYNGGEPRLSLIILVGHVSVLALLFWAWKSQTMRARIAALTESAVSAGHVTTARGRTGVPRAEETAAERTLREAATRVASGWPQPVEAAMQRGHAGSAMVLSWDDGGLRRSVIAVAPDSGGLELTGALQAAGQPPERRPLGRDVTPLDVEHVTLMLRLAMETVAGWSPARDEPARVPPAPAPSGD